MRNKLSLSLKRQVPDCVSMFLSLFFVALRMGYPLFQSLYLSLMQCDFNFDPQPISVGLNSYIKVFSDFYFMDALRSTVVFTIVFLPGAMVISLILAVMLNKGVRGLSFFRTCTFLPVVVPLSLTGIIFQRILNKRCGLLNWFLIDVLHRGTWAQNWSGDGNQAMVSIIVVSLWKNIDILVVLLTAGLQAISNDTMEAARIDGVNMYQHIVYITLPNLKESYMICGIRTVVQAVRVFEQPFTMARGGPGTTILVLCQYTQINVFKYFEMGYVPSIAYFTGVIILLLSVFGMFPSREDDTKIGKVRA